MKLIVCIDDNGGLAFNNRRQSQDKALCERILEIVGNSALYMTEYSRKIFGESAHIKTDDNFIDVISKDDFFFAENIGISAFEDKIDRIILYRWNRRYPFDLKLDIDLSAGWKVRSSYEFKGNSHEKITEEIYERNG